MGKDKVFLPSSAGGLTRYSESLKTKIKFGPDKVVFITILFALIVLLLLKFNPLCF